MKLRELFAVAAISIFTACGTPYRATDTTVVVAPYGLQTDFITQYPDATNVVWSYHDPVVVVPVDFELAGWTTMDTDDYLVRFNMDNEDYYAWYDDDGTWIGTAYVVRDHSTMPTAITNLIINQYPGYSITAVNREFEKDRMAYEVELKNSDTKVKLLIDANGNIIKQKSRPLY